MRRYYLLVLMISICLISSCKHRSNEKANIMVLEQKIARFVPTEITADVSRLSVKDKNALNKIVQAAELMDHIYLNQVWTKNPELLESLKIDTSAEGKLRLQYFLMNMGPWSQVDNNEAFIEGVPKTKPAGANFYPEDMTKEEFNQWLNTLSDTDREKAVGFFHVIRRNEQGKLKIVPYSEEYNKWLKPASIFLKEAAALTDNVTLKKYLLTRADAFFSNDYFKSDVAWLELDSPIDVTIGPYETYTDELFGYKAAFEAFVAIRDEEETRKLSTLTKHLQEIENNLPIEPRYRNSKLAPLSPISVVNLIYATGDGNHGVQTAAFNLPNDERVIQQKGAKRVMLKNVQEAKFGKILKPISQQIIEPSQLSYISFNAFFTHILAHELMHGLGPHSIIVAGRKTNVRQELKELYSAIEEAKADITGLFALQYLIDRGIFTKELESETYTTFLASMFRSVRFGINEAHGKGVAIQFNFLLEEGAIETLTDGKFRINKEKIRDAVKKLTGIILTIEAEGNYNEAKALIDKYANISPTMQKALDKVRDIPIDIKPIYTLISDLAGRIR